MSKSRDKSPWNPFPLASLKVKGLSACAKSILIYLAARSNHKGETCVGHRTICRELVRSKDFVTKGLAELRDKKVITETARIRWDKEADWRIINPAILVNDPAQQEDSNPAYQDDSEEEKSCLAGLGNPEEQDKSNPAQQGETLQIKPNLTDFNLTEQNLKKERKEETEVASLPPVGDDKPEQVLLSSKSVDLLEGIWKDRTSYGLSPEDKTLAQALVVKHGSEVVATVLRNTINVRPKSAKLRWNKFRVFARNYERNYEEYLAYMAVEHPTSPVVTKFKVVQNVTQETYDHLIQWFKDYGKLGDWNIRFKELEDFGATPDYLAAVIALLVHDECAVNRKRFLELMYECMGVDQPKVVAAAAAEVVANYE